MPKTKTGDLIEVTNKLKRTSANQSYFYVEVETSFKKYSKLLFTKHQIQVAAERAQKNKEDLL